jgi:transposase
VDAVPLNGQVRQLERYDIPVSVATLSNWMLKIGTDRVQPLINLMVEQALDAGLMLMDETTVQVLQSEKSPASEHYMWVRLAVLPATETEPARRILLFTYAPYRNAETLQRLLEGFTGKLITDGLDLYNTYADLNKLVHGTCNAHARRGFEDARKIAEGETKKNKAEAEKPNSTSARARVALNFFRDIYRIEREIKALSPAAKFAIRQERSAPIMFPRSDLPHKRS